MSRQLFEEDDPRRPRLLFVYKSIIPYYPIRRHFKQDHTATKSTTISFLNTHQSKLRPARSIAIHLPIHEMQIILILAIILGSSQLVLAIPYSSLDNQYLYRNDSVLVPRKGGGGHGGGGHGSSGGGRGSDGAASGGGTRKPAPVAGSAGSLTEAGPVWIVGIIAGTVVLAGSGV